MKTNCLHCGEPLPEVKSNRREYCTVTCRRAADYLRNQEDKKARAQSYYTPKGVRTRACAECGEDFEYTRADAEFCSRRCGQRNWAKNNPEKVAAQKARATLARQAEAAARKAAEPIRVCEVDGCERTDIRPAREGTECSMHNQRTRRAAKRATEHGVRICPECGADMSTARANAVRCSEKCTRAANQERNKDAIREQRRIHQATRRAIHDGRVVVAFTLDEWEELKVSLGDECTYCGITAAQLATHPVNKGGRGNTLEIDHIVPLTRNGAHALTNLTPACPKCNQSKKNHRLLAEWAPPRLGGLPRYDRTRPRGSKYIDHDPAKYRTTGGPLPHVALAAAEHPALLRAVRIAEEDLALAA